MMKPKIKNILCSIVLALSVSGCVSSKIEHLTEYRQEPIKTFRLTPEAIDEYHFISWEPFHFILTLGILPQYHYAVFETEPDKYEKHSTIIGWVAIPMYFTPSWEFGHIPEEKRRPKLKAKPIYN